MIKDTLLVSALVISFVLLYRIYIQSQKINNLEEKFNILDNFTQTMFKYIVNNETKEKENIITYSNNDNKSNEESNEVLNNQNLNEINTNQDSEKESEYHEYNALQENVLQHNVTPENVIQEISENYENKEIMSEMVSQLKETLLQNNKELIEQEINEIEELKQELKQDLKKSESSDTNNDELFNILNNSDVPIKNETNNLKKKEEDLMKMKMGDIKALAKLKNIPLLQHNKLKKKEVLIQNLLSLS